MKHVKNIGSSFLMVICIMTIGTLVGCGVKGDPIPPATPVELGRGQPTYKRATEEFAFPDIPPIRDDETEGEQRKSGN